VDASPEKFAAEARNFRADISYLRKEAKNWMRIESATG